MIEESEVVVDNQIRSGKIKSNSTDEDTSASEYTDLDEFSAPPVILAEVGLLESHLWIYTNLCNQYFSFYQRSCSGIIRKRTNIARKVSFII